MSDKESLTDLYIKLLDQLIANIDPFSPGTSFFEEHLIRGEMKMILDLLANNSKINNDSEKLVNTLRKELSKKEEEIIQLKNQLSNQNKERLISTGRMNADTHEKIKRLGNYRDKILKENGNLPVWTVACKINKVDPKTVKKHAPELREKWDNKEFFWSEKSDS